MNLTPIRSTPSGTDTYRCDANGNTIGGGSTYATTTKYDAANLPTAIVRSSGAAQFLYDPLNRRAREFTTTDYTFFAGDGYERWGTTTNGVSRHELGPVVVTTQPTNGGTGTASHLFYELRDRLGSTLALVDDATPTPAGTQYRDYDAFGSVRNPIAGNLPWLPNGLNYVIDPAAPVGMNATLHGFTDHEHLDNVKLIHMNGRVYDYVLGRFLSVDPVIQNKANSQSLNPYSYIGNNPLSGTDPTGYAACTGSNIDRGNAPGDCADQGVSTIWVNRPASSLSSNGAVRQGSTGHKSAGPASDIGSTKDPVDHCATGPLTCHKITPGEANADDRDKLISSHDIDGVGFINGITGTEPRHAELAETHLGAEFKPMPSSFVLIDSPSAGLLADVAKIGLTQMGISQAVAKQLASILLDVQRDGHKLDLVCHSGGCAELKAAISYAFASTRQSLTSIRVNFHAGANNMWLTNAVLSRAGVARFGGINAQGYRYNPAIWFHKLWEVMQCCIRST
jgi:RHS repeat-associated protein